VKYIQEKTEFLENGVVIIRQLIQNNIIEECVAELKKFENRKIAQDLGHLLLDRQDDVESIKYFQYINVYIKSFNKLLNSKILNIGQFFLDQDVYFSPMGLHNKGPRIGTITPAHQDNFYSCLTPPDFVTAYIPLMPMAEYNGGIQYALGSHKLDVLDHTASSVKAFSSGLDSSIISTYSVLKPDLKPGDVVFHHGNTIHFANENKSLDERYAVAIGIFGVNTSVDVDLKVRYEKNFQTNRGIS